MSNFQIHNQTLCKEEKNVFGYIGDVKNGHVRGQSHHNVWNIQHKDVGYNEWRWRYDGETNKVVWTNEPFEEDKIEVENWLNKRNIFPEKHILLSMRYSISESSFRIYNETLCPDLWNEYFQLDPKVRVNLLRMAHDFYKKTKLPAPIIDIYLMGSIANYNWTPDSDADVHIMVDYNKLQMPPETAFKTVKIVGSQWNSEHRATVKNHKVEINLQNIHEIKPHVTGIYSLIKDQWLRKPVRQTPQIDKTVVQTQYKAMKKYIENSLNSGDVETMKSAKDYLDAYRQYGLDTMGELSYENIVFKILRSKGIIKLLKDSIVAAYDKEMSVSEDKTNTYYDTMTDDEKDALAMTYFDIGHDDDPKGPPYYTWIWDGNKILVKKDTTHGAAFSHSVSDRTFKGRFDPEKNAISVVFPGFELRKLSGRRPTVDDIPQRIYSKLLSKFNTNPRFEVFESQLKQVRTKDIKQRHPQDPSIYDPVTGKINLNKLTLDNLMALRQKTARSIAYWKKQGGEESEQMIKRDMEEFKLYYDEIKRRLSYINNPVLNEIHISGIIKDDDIKSIDGQHYLLAKIVDDYHSYKRWKWDSGSDVVFWWNTPTSDEKQVVSNYIEKRFGKTIWKHSYAPCLDEDIKNKNFTIKFGEPDLIKTAGKIFLNGEWFANTYPYPEDYKKYAGKWVINRHTKSFELGLPAINKLFDSYQDVLDYLENWYESLNSIKEGYGWGLNPEKDPLHIPGERWRIKFGGRKTPKMKEEEFIDELIDQLLTESPEMKTLKKNKKPLTDEERQLVMNAKAVWHHGPNGEETPAVWKSIVAGKTWYICHTHRAYQAKPTIKGAIRAFDFIKTTA